MPESRASQEDAADVRIERSQEIERVRRHVERLGEPCRSLLLEMFADPPRPYRLIAAELGLPVGSLGPRRARCLTRLRRLMQKDRDRPQADRTTRRSEPLAGRIS